jgi:hypothetical protein
LRTIAYVDGYNLYYGRLQGTPYKWLDLQALIRDILHVQNPDFELVSVHYFTAPVIARLASHGSASVEAQNSYIRALQATGVLVTQGRHQLERGRAPRYIEGQTADRADSVPIWNLDEKETDVRLALSMYRDASRGAAEQVVLVTSDTDMVAALDFIKSDFGLQIGLILPRRPSGGRPPAGSLINLADWARQQIRDEELQECQLPARVPTKRKPADKPDYW